MGFKIDEVRLHQISMPLVHFFETSFGRTYSRDMILVEVVSGGVSGWGEVTCGEHPFYNEEWTESAWHAAEELHRPKVWARRLQAEPGRGVSAGIRGHKMAQGGFEVACWDLQARLNACRSEGDRRRRTDRDRVRLVDRH